MAVAPEPPTRPVKSVGKSDVPEEQQRYLMYTFYNAGYNNDPNFNWTSIETAIKNGFNGIMLAVPWDEVCPTRNSAPNWTTLDKQIARITQLGAKVGLLIGLHRDIDRVDSFWPSDGFARTYKNEVLYKAHAYQFSPAHQPTVDLATDFVRQVAERYNNYQQQGSILFISVVNSPIMEQEYSASSAVLYQAGESNTVLDYSKPMITGFRTWLKTKYTTISALNAAWGRSYAQFDEIQPPGLYGNDIYAAFAGKPGKDWYTYRHKVHKALVEQTTKAIKGVNSTYKVINQHGSVYDNLSVLRGSLGFKDYALNTDGVKVNDSPYYLHRFSMDVVRSNIAPGKWVLNELDGIDNARIGLQTYLDQITQSFEHGAKAITFSNFGDAPSIDFARQLVQQIRAQGWLNQPVPTITPVGVIPLKLSQLVNDGYGQLGIAGQWTQMYNQNGNKPIRLPIDEDILDTTPLTPAPVSSLSLLTPTVDCSTGVLTFKTAGGDGTPVEFKAVGLRDWSTTATLTLDSTQRQSAVLALLARQSGNETATLSYTASCPTTKPVNKPPVLVTPVPAQTLVQGSSYSLVIPASTFTDPDGVIATWALSSLPTGLTYNQTTRLISGTATTVGSTVAQLTVTDDGGATAQQAISFLVYATTPVASTTATPTPTPASALTLVTPDYNCVTGKMIFRTRGGDGTPIEFMALGIKPWGRDSVVILDPWMRNGITFTLKARQSGKESLFTYVTTCQAPPANKPPVVVTPIVSQTATLARSFSFVIPAATFSDPDGQLVSWSVSNLPVGLTFDATTRLISGTPSLIGPNVVTVTVTDNAGASVQTTFIIQVLGNNTTPTTPPTTPTVATGLTLLAPAYDCVTGKMIFRSSGGDGTPIEYMAVGIKSWSTDSVAILDPWMRDGVNFTLRARQSGKQVAYAFKSSCQAPPVVVTPPANKPPVVVTPIASQTATLARSFSFVIPAATFSDPDGQLVSWSVSNLPVGLTFDATTRLISGTPSLIGPNVVTVTVTDNAGASVQTTFIIQVLGNNTTPTTPPTTPTVATGLTLLAPAYDCVTGKMIFRSSGGDGTPIEYMAVGIKSWSTDSVAILDPWMRDGVNFTLRARQSGKQVAYAFKSSCQAPPVVVTPPANKPPVVVTPIASQTATLARSFSFVIPAATFSDPDGQLVSWSVSNLPVGLTFDATTRLISGTPSLIGPNVVTVTVTDNAGASVQTTFIIQVLGNNTTPRTMALTLLAPSFDCATGRLVFRSSGGDGTPIEYMAVGLKVWSPDSVAFVESFARNGISYTLKARQSAKEVNYMFVTTCGGYTPPASTTTTPVTPANPSALLLVSPQSRIVYQRNQANQATVPVIGQAPAAATRVEARLVPVVDGQGTLLDWTDMPLSGDKTFTANLTHTGGWYRLEVRAWNGATQLTQQTIDRVGIGEVFVVAGQSNAYGGFEVRPGAGDDRVSCLDYKDDNLAEAALPVRFSHIDVSVSVGPSNPKHVWAELGDKLTKRLNVPVLFLGAAQSGTGSEQWRQSADNSGIPFPDNMPYRRLGATLLHYIARTGARAVLWHQGEGDQGRTTQSYVDNLTVVINKSRQQSGNSTLPWVVSRASYVYSLTDPNIIAAQNRLINEMAQVYPGPETDQLGPIYRPIDNVHISGIGATRFVELWDQSLSSDFFNRSAPVSVNSYPQITTGYVLSGVHLAGQTIAVPYVVAGNPDGATMYSVQLIRESDGSVAATLGSGRENPMTVTLPATLANGMYRAKVVSANLTATAGEPFLVGASGGRVAAPEAEAARWQVWPNPVERELTVTLPATVTAAKLRTVLSTISGLNQPGVIESSPVENGQLHLTLPTMQTGLYFLHIYDGDKPLQTLKVFHR